MANSAPPAEVEAAFVRLRSERLSRRDEAPGRELWRLLAARNRILGERSAIAPGEQSSRGSRRPPRSLLLGLLSAALATEGVIWNRLPAAPPRVPEIPAAENAAADPAIRLSVIPIEFAPGSAALDARRAGTLRSLRDLLPRAPGAEVRLAAFGGPETDEGAALARARVQAVRDALGLPGVVERVDWRGAADRLIPQVQVLVYESRSSPFQKTVAGGGGFGEVFYDGKAGFLVALTTWQTLLHASEWASSRSPGPDAEKVRGPQGLAAIHWRRGIEAYRNGKGEAALRHLGLCAELDPAHAACRAGLWLGGG